MLFSFSKLHVLWLKVYYVICISVIWAAVSAIVSLVVLLTVYFVQLLSSHCKFEQIKID